MLNKWCGWLERAKDFLSCIMRHRSACWFLAFSYCSGWKMVPELNLTNTARVHKGERSVKCKQIYVKNTRKRSTREEESVEW